MQTIPITLQNLNLYSPSTGEVICHEETGYNEDARSLMGYWKLEIIDEPFIKNPHLQLAWDAYMEASNSLLEEDDEFPGPSVDEFLHEYNDHPTWIAFRIETEGIIGDIAWFVVEMEMDAVEEMDNNADN